VIWLIFPMENPPLAESIVNFFWGGEPLKQIQVIVWCFEYDIDACYNVGLWFQ
jgi:hypothetical protein